VPVVKQNIVRLDSAQYRSSDFQPKSHAGD